MPQPNAQISIWQSLNGEETHLEIPYGSGRKKLDLPKDQNEWGNIILSELTLQAQWLKREEIRKKELEREKELRTQEKKFQKQLESYKKIHKNDPGMEMWEPKRTHIFTYRDLLINEDD